MLRRCLVTSLQSVKQLTGVSNTVQCGRQIRLLSTSIPSFTKPTTESSLAKTQNQPQKVTTEPKALELVDEVLTQGQEGRLFAIVQLCGKQFKVTDGDIILIEGYWYPNIGDKIRLDKVLVVGSKEFSLIGTPILEQGLVDIQATIIEKTLTHTKTNFRKKKTKQYMRINFDRNQLTMVRINSIQIKKTMKEASQQPTTEETIRIYE